MPTRRQVLRRSVHLFGLAALLIIDAASAHDLIFTNGFGSVVAIISHPGDGEQRTAAVPIAFVGSASEPATLVWTSNLDGQIGTGGSFSASLSVGVHEITLRATTADPETAAAQIELTVIP